MVAKKAVSEILGASSKPETVLARLGALRGEEMVISHGGTTYTIKLPALVKTSDLENVFSALSSSLGCCQNLFSKLVRHIYPDLFNFGFLGLDTVRNECSNCDNRPPPVKRKPPAEQEAATSTTPADTASLSESPLASLNKTPTQEWGIEEVIQFIESTDPCLGVHAELFRKHVSRL